MKTKKREREKYLSIQFSPISERALLFLRFSGYGRVSFELELHADEGEYVDWWNDTDRRKPN